MTQDDPEMHEPHVIGQGARWFVIYLVIVAIALGVLAIG